MKLHFMGTGSSLGVPVLGCTCAVCQSEDPLNKRWRSGVVLEHQNKRILFDMSPDFYHMALRHNITHLDGIMITHTHQDHIAGIDDLRPLCLQRGIDDAMPVLLSKASHEDLVRRYPFLLQNFRFQFIEEDLEQKFLGIKYQTFTFYQQKKLVNAYRVDELGFLTDLENIEDVQYEVLQGVKVLVISSSGSKATKAHITLEQALQICKVLGVEQGWITHIPHSVDHKRVNAQLPSGIQLAYDGLEVAW